MTRIIAGRWAGRRLAVPAGARPTTDRVREAMFSSLEHRLPGFAGRHVLDLFAGSGALGLEALSRGADHATAVERQRGAVALLRQNATALGAGAAFTVVAADAWQWSPHGRPVDLLLVDPPYEAPSQRLAGLLRRIDRGGALTAGALVVVERPRRDRSVPFPSGWEHDQRSYGETAVWYGRAQRGSPPELREG
jgi:16S rRNA (guanine966-N2)-methyltransferase